MEIRAAKPEDAKAIAPLLFLAMEDILYAFLDTKSKEAAVAFLEYHVRASTNQYSFENCMVIVNNHKVVAVVNYYEGAHLQLLRAPIANYIKNHHNPQFNPEDETQEGEIYIDTIGVDPEQQGKGLGSTLLRYLIDEIVTKEEKTLGLLVEEEKPQAQKLYNKMGFTVVGNKTLAGKKLAHMQIAPTGKK